MTKLEKYMLESKLETAMSNRDWFIEKSVVAMNDGDLDELDYNLNIIKEFDNEISCLLCDLSVSKFEEDQLSLW